MGLAERILAILPRRAPGMLAVEVHAHLDPQPGQAEFNRTLTGLVEQRRVIRHQTRIARRHHGRHRYYRCDQPAPAAPPANIQPALWEA